MNAPVTRSMGVAPALRAAALEHVLPDLMNKGIAVQIRVTGDSMRPALRSSDWVTLEPTRPEHLHRGDLVLFRNTEGALVLHRLVRFLRAADGNREFQTRGDARWRLDVPFLSSRLLARVSRIERGGRIIETGRPAARLMNALIAWRGLAISWAGYRIDRLRNGSNRPR